MDFIIAIDGITKDKLLTIGDMLEKLGETLESQGLLKIGHITRHPLPGNNGRHHLKDQVAHAMMATSDFKQLNELTVAAQGTLDALVYPNVSMHLCIVVPELLEEKERLLNYGQRALSSPMTYEETRSLADRLSGVSLSKHGEENHQALNALAAAALRLGGQHGFFKQLICLEEEALMSVEEILKLDGVDEVRHIKKLLLSLSDRIQLTKEEQLVCLDHKAVLLVKGHRLTGLDTLKTHILETFFEDTEGLE